MHGSRKKQKNKDVCKNVVNLYNTLRAIYFNDCNNITDEEKEEMEKKYDPSKHYKYDESYQKDEKKSLEEAIAETGKLIREKSEMPPLEADKEVKEEKVLKIFTANKLLTRIYCINSCKLKDQIRQLLYLLYQHNKITKNIYKKLIKSL